MWNDGGASFGGGGGGGGGGGYQSMDTSANFGGGGFMQDNQFGSPTTNSQEKKRSSRTQSVIPCTIKQLNSAVYQQIDDVFRLGTSTDLSQVSFIGVIRSAQESSTNIVYQINDMTGDDIMVKKWVNDTEESEDERDRRSACRENTYVQVTGNLKSFQEKGRSVIAFSLLPVEDFNQITYHMLEVIHAHLALQKMPEIGSDNIIGMKTPGKGGFQGGSFDSPGMGGGGGGNSGLSGVQKQVHELISSCNNEEGMGISNLRQRLKAVSEVLIRGAVEFLSNEGHIYSTIDDEHFKSTDSTV